MDRSYKAAADGSTPSSSTILSKIGEVVNTTVW